MAIKDQLEAAGYDTSNLDESSIIAQLDKAGYDTTSLAPKGPNLSALQAEDKPLQDISLTPVTEESLNQAGTQIAESKFGQKHPIAGAAVGTVVAKLPDFITAAQGIASAPKLAASIKSIPELIKGMKGALTSDGRPAAQTIVSTLEKQLAEHPIKIAGRKQALEEALAESKKGIGAVEEKLGLAMKQVPSAADDVPSFANTMKGIGDKSAEELLSVFDPAELHRLKKIAQVTKRGSLIPEEKALINAGVDKIDQALSKAYPELSTELSRFREATDALSNLPGESKLSAQNLRSSLLKAKQELMQKGKSGGAVKNYLGKALKGAVTGMGATLGYKLFK